MFQVSAQSFDSLTVGNIARQTVPHESWPCSRSSVIDGRKARSRHFQLQWTRWHQPLSAGNVCSTV